ncbi:hypothetical protein AVEN_183204-1 [Araneus ventricosus]|uniref:DUF5641 domain-containing protein n=1 Tax=Araneus ventricosus TaxID=182803 RepID=A0A4Y2Q227_ARAVE|nr:hypothetical protein AVEN_183204-1 [Araneus ventricosus]
MKDLLKRVLGETYLSHEEMMTVLCDCEAIINNRLLTYVSENDTDFTPISPSMFIQDIREWTVPDLDVADHNSLNERIKYRETIQKDLRDRCRSEYLGQLVPRRTCKESRPISVGDIVLVGSDNLKRIHWPLGKIIELPPGSIKTNPTIDAYGECFRCQYLAIFRFFGEKCFVKFFYFDNDRERQSVIRM